MPADPVFTQEDVEALEEAIDLLHGPKMDALRGVEAKLSDLKDRIEALLSANAP